MLRSGTVISTNVKPLLPPLLLRSEPLGSRLNGCDPLSLKEDDAA